MTQTGACMLQEVPQALPRKHMQGMCGLMDIHCLNCWKQLGSHLYPPKQDQDEDKEDPSQCRHDIGTDLPNVPIICAWVLTKGQLTCYIRPHTTPGPQHATL